MTLNVQRFQTCPALMQERLYVNNTETETMCKKLILSFKGYM